MLSRSLRFLVLWLFFFPPKEFLKICKRQDFVNVVIDVIRKTYIWCQLRLRSANVSISSKASISFQIWEAEVQKSLKFTLMLGAAGSLEVCDLLPSFPWAQFRSSKLLFSINKAFHGSMPCHVFGARLWKTRAVLKRGLLRAEWNAPCWGLQLGKVRAETLLSTLTLGFAEILCGGGRSLLWYNLEQGRPQG